MTTRDFFLGSQLPLAADDAPVSQARPAATVMLVRDAVQGIEVFMLRRARSMAFAASMLVFPGGRVDVRDTDDDLRWAGPSAQEWAQRMDCGQSEARGFIAAAVREVFEETGVLLAGTDGEGGRLADPAARRRARAALEVGEIPLSQLLEETGTDLRSDLLTYRAHWVTPEIEPRRYDTRFFVAELPAGQEPDGDTSEAEEAAWVRPEDALARHADGALALMPPTLVCLEDLAAAGSVSRAMTAPPAVPRVLPYLAQTDAGPALRVELA